MCGIIGVRGNKPAQDLLLHSLRKMEYRGYDSAGICTLEEGFLHCVKAAGKLNNLQARLNKEACAGSIGIGHTRWATHGGPSEVNAHPHLGQHSAIVHNGIIENHEMLRRQLQERGYKFLSQTDTEVIPLQLEYCLQQTGSAKDAWWQMLRSLEGAYALAGLITTDPSSLWFARKGSPLLLGRNKSALFTASDALAVAGLADEVMYLREGEWGRLSERGCEVFDITGAVVEPTWEPLDLPAVDATKGAYRHFMEKEMHEQPQVLQRIFDAYIKHGNIEFPQAAFLNSAPLPKRIVLVACGTSYHAALTARYWLERYLQVPVEVDVASEYRYRNPVIGPDTLLITLSQSGETADTLEALRLFKSRTPDNVALSICNIPTASLPRESDGLIELLAGPEVGVASTKAYMAQLAVLALLALLLAYRAKAIAQDELDGHLGALKAAVSGVDSILHQAAAASSAIPLFAHAHGALYLGRGPCYPLALEGALKLKEISYLHAEGYPAGEMKHGPIALIDHNLPVIVIAPQQYHLDKVLSNLKEVQARGAKVILLTDLERSEWPTDVNQVIQIPEGDYFSTPLLACVPLQLLAYEVALSRGTDVDQPRNLAKSVTVE